MTRTQQPTSDDQHLPQGGGPNGTARPKIEVEESAEQDIPEGLEDPDSEPEELPDDLGPEDDY